MENNTIKDLVNHWKKETSTNRQARASSGWNSGNEAYLVWLAEEIRGYIWICEYSISFYNTINRIIKLSSIIFMACTAGLSASNIISTTNITFAIIMTVISILSAVASGIDYIVDFTEKAAGFKNPLTSLKKLNYVVGHKINSKRRDRGQANDTIQDILNELFIFTDNMPVPPSIVPWMYARKYQKLGIHTPNQVEKLRVADESPAKKLGDTHTTDDTPRTNILRQTANLINKTGFNIPVMAIGDHGESSDDDSCSDDDHAINFDMEYQLRRYGNGTSVSSESSGDDKNSLESDK